jgi:hypothetical protein
MKSKGHANLPSAAKARTHFAAFAARLKRLRKNSKQSAKADVSAQQGLKPTLNLKRLRHD